MSQTILITGGAGFVGSSLSIALKEKESNYRVLAFDNLKRRGSELNLPRLKEANVDFFTVIFAIRKILLYCQKLI